jgi:hypothetical protein
MIPKIICKILSHLKNLDIKLDQNFFNKFHKILPIFLNHCTKLCDIKISGDCKVIGRQFTTITQYEDNENFKIFIDSLFEQHKNSICAIS